MKPKAKINLGCQAVLNAGTISACAACHAGVTTARIPSPVAMVTPVIASEKEGRKAIRMPSVPKAKSEI